MNNILDVGTTFAQVVVLNLCVPCQQSIANDLNRPLGVGLRTGNFILNFANEFAVFQQHTVSSKNVSLLGTEYFLSAGFNGQQLFFGQPDRSAKARPFLFKITDFNARRVNVPCAPVNTQHPSHHNALRDSQTFPAPFRVCGTLENIGMFGCVGRHNFISPKPASKRSATAAMAACSSWPSAMARNSVPPLAASIRTFRIDLASALALPSSRSR